MLGPELVLIWTDIVCTPARCLRKPFTPDALLAAINDCLDEHRPGGAAAPVVRVG